MLHADLARLRRDGRLRFEAEVPANAGLWEETDIHLKEPLEVKLELRLLGSDIVARGTLRGKVKVKCRRCLINIVLPIDVSVDWVYRSDVDEDEAVNEGSYTLSNRGTELDLSGAVREHVLLAVPRFVLCDAACKGLCPRCGTQLNEQECDCEIDETDERWAALRELLE